MTWRYLRLALVGVVVIGWIPLLGVTGSRLIGGQVTPLAQVASFAPLAGAGWVLALALLLLTRSWRLSLVAGVLVLLHVVWLAPPVVERLRADPVPVGVPLRVLTINAQYGGADVESVARVVAARDIDLVAVQELTPQFAALFQARTRGQLPYSALYPAADSAAGSGIWSRWPVTADGLLTSPFRMPRVRVEVPKAGAVQVIGVHAMSPLPERVTQWRTDLAMLAEQAQARSAAGQPLIMLGDFNASRDHAPFRALTSGPLADAADGAVVAPWTAQSWPADRRWIPAVVRIDHVLVSRDAFAVSRLVTTGIGGTDHRAVVAYLVIRPR